MSAPGPAPSALPKEIYASLTGAVDAAMVQRVMQSMAVCVNGGVQAVHLLWQSPGGGVPEGVALYNYFRALPLDLRFYNGGSVSSIAVIAFLGAKRRYASANATFVIHRTHTTDKLPPTESIRLRVLADTFEIEDARTRAILEANLTIPKEQLEYHLMNDLPFDANAALRCELICEVKDFILPPGCQISNI